MAAAIRNQTRHDMCLQVYSTCTMALYWHELQEAPEEAITDERPVEDEQLVLPSFVNNLHPDCNDLCPAKFYCPKEKKPFCPRYNRCRPHLTTLTVARLLAAAKVKFNEAGRPDHFYRGDELVPENDPEFLLAWLGKELFPPTRHNNLLIDVQLNKIFPGTRELITGNND